MGTCNVWKPRVSIYVASPATSWQIYVTTIASQRRFPLMVTLAMLVMPVKWKAPKSFKLTCHYQNVKNASDQIEVFPISRQS